MYSQPWLLDLIANAMYTHVLQSAEQVWHVHACAFAIANELIESLGHMQTSSPINGQCYVYAHLACNQQITGLAVHSSTIVS